MRVPSIATVAAITLLSACDAVTAPGLLAAAALDPLETPPQQLALAVSLPESVRLRDGDAILHLSYSDGTDPMVSETVPLTITPITGLELASGDHAYRAALVADDARRFAAAQRAIKELRSDGVEGTGSFGLSVVGGCTTAPLPDALPVATWLQPGPEAAFVPLTRRANAYDGLGPDEAATLRAAIGPCP
ncbi:MAG: hypothetical protein AAF919_11145 [Pseudomonadota bacterium]